MPADLAPTVLQLIRDCIPTLQAAEVLLFLAAHPDHEWTPEEIVVGMRPTVVTVPAVKEYAHLLARRGAIAERSGRYTYAATAEIEATIAGLVHAYNERPVTLVGAIYRIADEKVQSFADAFRLRED